MTTWLTAKEAADYARCDVATLRRARKSGKLQAFPVNAGRHVRFRAEDVDRWLMAAPVKKVQS